MTQILAACQILLPGLVIIAGGCGVANVDTDTQTVAPDQDFQIATSDDSSLKPQAIEIVDRLGRKVTFAQSPQRIVSLSPETTELLFALGLGDRMVGVTEHCNFPPEAQRVDKVGIGTVETISRERIIAVKPDVIFCKWDNHEPLIETFERLQIPIVGMGAENLNDFYQEARLVGKITGHFQQAESLVAKMQQRLEALRQQVPNDAKGSGGASTAGLGPTVFYQLYDEPLMTVTPESFIGEVLSLAGLRNIVQGGANRYPTVNAEVVIAQNPDVILMAATHSADEKIDEIRRRPGWAHLNAVTHNRIYAISGDEISRCGPRLLDALEQVIAAVYSESLR